MFDLPNSRRRQRAGRAARSQREGFFVPYGVAFQHTLDCSAVEATSW